MVRSFITLLAFCGILSSTYARPHKSPRSSTAPPLPSSGLPSPGNATLKLIALGVGHQNYTCNATTGTYSSNVAMASLYDATEYLSRNPSKVDTISQARLAQYKENSENQSASNYDPRLKRAGLHYFAPSPPTPDFDLTIIDSFLSAKKVKAVPAPNSTNIDWLYLVDNGNGQTHGVSSVYRVHTAEGRPPTSCYGSGKIYVPYVAQYWFYE